MLHLCSLTRALAVLAELQIKHGLRILGNAGIWSSLNSGTIIPRLPVNHNVTVTWLVIFSDLLNKYHSCALHFNSVGH